MSNPQHLAEQSAATRIAEHKGWALSKLTGTIPDGKGTHRAEEEQ